jgi:hypothetical protein
VLQESSSDRSSQCSRVVHQVGWSRECEVSSQARHGAVRTTGVAHHSGNGKPLGLIIIAKGLTTTHFKRGCPLRGACPPALATAGVTLLMTPAVGGGAAVGPGESLACCLPTCPLEVSSHAAQGVLSERPRVGKVSSCGCREAGTMACATRRDLDSCWDGAAPER